MKINRTMTIETSEIQISDRIQVGHYTATCQALPGEGLALFLLDQYLDKAMQMNKRSTNKGGYQESDLRKELNSEKILKDFTSLELAPFDNGERARATSGDGSRTSTSGRRRVSAVSTTTVVPTPGAPRPPSASARLS